MADTGWLSLSSFASDSSIGTDVWETTSGAAVDNDASVARGEPVSPETTTQYLRALDLIGSVPGNATIRGVEAKFNRFTGSAQGNDNSIRLFVNGAASGANRSAGAQWSSNSVEEDKIFGGPNDLWGLSLTPDIVNAANFGVGISAIGMDVIFSVDFIAMKIYYDPGAMLLAM